MLCILIRISLTKGPINNKSALVQVMSWRRPVDKPCISWTNADPIRWRIYATQGGISWRIYIYIYIYIYTYISASQYWSMLGWDNGKSPISHQSHYLHPYWLPFIQHSETLPKLYNHASKCSIEVIIRMYQRILFVHFDNVSNELTRKHFTRFYA